MSLLVVGKLPTVQIELSNKEAEEFVLYRKYQDSIKKILDSGVLNLRNGSAVLHFDGEGTLKEIREERVSYKMGK